MRGHCGGSLEIPLVSGCAPVVRAEVVVGGVAAVDRWEVTVAAGRDARWRFTF